MKIDINKFDDILDKVFSEKGIKEDSLIELKFKDENYIAIRQDEWTTVQKCYMEAFERYANSLEDGKK